MQTKYTDCDTQYVDQYIIICLYCKHAASKIDSLSFSAIKGKF